VIELVDGKPAHTHVLWKQLELEQTMFAGEGGAVSFRLFPNGQGLSYRWFKTTTVFATGTQSVTPIAVDKPTLTLRNLTVLDGGTGSVSDGNKVDVTYTGVVLVPDGSFKQDGTANTVEVQSVPFTLVVQALPLFKQSPLSPDLLPVGTNTLPKGDTLSLSVGGLFSDDTVYQWYFRQKGTAAWVPVPGASQRIYNSDSGVQEGDEGDYRLEATNPVGTVSSDSVYVKVIDPVVATLVASATEVNPGGSLTITADVGDAVSTGALQIGQSYELWKQSKTTGAWVLVKSQLGNQFTLANLQKADDTNYRVRAYGKVNGRVDSAPVKISVRDMVAFAVGTTLTTTSLAGGDAIALKVSATGYDPVYKWYRKADASSSWVQVGQGGTYNITSASAADSGTYGVIVSNSFSQADSKGTHALVTDLVASPPREMARITVNVPPSVQTVSASVTAAKATVPTTSNGVLGEDKTAVVLAVNANEGDKLTLNFGVKDAAGSTVRYQWRKDGVALPESGKLLVFSNTSVTLNRATVTSADEGRYDLLVSNAYGLSTSAGVQVTVSQAPKIDVQPVDAITSEGGTAT
jgi:hypothetical protein